MVFLVALTLMALTGARLAFAPGVVLPFLAVLLGGYGLGFAMASLALLYKRVGQLLGLSQFLLLFPPPSPRRRALSSFSPWPRGRPWPGRCWRMERLWSP
jgi:hypothetical protein